MKPSIFKRIFWLLTLPLAVVVWVVLRPFRRKTKAEPVEQVPAAVLMCEFCGGLISAHNRDCREPLEPPGARWNNRTISSLDTQHIERILDGLKRGTWSWGAPATATQEQRIALRTELRRRKRVQA